MLNISVFGNGAFGDILPERKESTSVYACVGGVHHDSVQIPFVDYEGSDS